MKKIKYIIFDLGGVILNIDYSLTIKSLINLGVKNAGLLYSKKSQAEIFNKLEIGEISEKKFLQEIGKKTNGAEEKHIKRAWNSMILDLPKSRMSILKKLKKNYTLFLLSNTNSIHIKKIQKQLGEEQYKSFLELFEKIYYSHEIGMRKPDPNIFKFIINENDLIEEEVLLVDDSIQHIESANNLKLSTYHILDDDITTLFPDIVQ